MNKILWFLLGIVLVGIAYIGIIVPGIPWSTPAVGAAYCFTRSSDKMSKWIYEHWLFGPFLSGWVEKKIFPTKAKYLMLVTMSISLIFAFFSFGLSLPLYSILLVMIITAIWGWKYPGSEKEYNRRKESGEKIAWLK